MASFTNFATLSYNGGTTNSNTVTGELLEALTVTKTAVVKNYAANDKITYIISIVNSGRSRWQISRSPITSARMNLIAGPSIRSRMCRILFGIM